MKNRQAPDPVRPNHPSIPDPQPFRWGCGEGWQLHTNVGDLQIALGDCPEHPHGSLRPLCPALCENDLRLLQLH